MKGTFISKWLFNKEERIDKIISKKKITTAEQLNNLSVEEKFKIIREIKEKITNQIINSCVDYTIKIVRVSTTNKTSVQYAYTWA